jgi:hypothetical protein
MEMHMRIDVSMNTVYELGPERWKAMPYPGGPCGLFRSSSEGGLWKIVTQGTDDDMLESLQNRVNGVEPE